MSAFRSLSPGVVLLLAVVAVAAGCPAPTTPDKDTGSGGGIGNTRVVVSPRGSLAPRASEAPLPSDPPSPSPSPAAPGPDLGASPLTPSAAASAVPSPVPSPTPTPPTRVVTLAGLGALTPEGEEAPPHADGPAAQAYFLLPTGVAVKADGTVYIADSGHNRIRMLKDGQVTTLAGDGTAGHLDTLGRLSRFNNPGGLALDAAGVLYVADTGNHRVRRIEIDGSGDVIVTTLAGSDTPALTNGRGMAAAFQSPQALAVHQGVVYVADTGNHAIRKISADGTVTTFAGTGDPGLLDGASPRFNEPRGLAVAENGDVFVADSGNHCVRRLTPAGAASRIAGSGEAGFATGQADAAALNTPWGLVLDGFGGLYVSDAFNHRIVRLPADRVIATLVGSGSQGEADGVGADASFSLPTALARDAAGRLYGVDQKSGRLRRVE